MEAESTQKYECLDFRSLVIREFSRRCSQNKQYSLRAFARQIETDASNLSKFFKGQTRFGHRKIAQISKHLKLTPEELNKVLHNEGLSESQLKMLLVDQKYFSFLSHWQNIVILEAVNMHMFEADPGWLSRRLNIDEVTARESLDLILELGLIERNELGVWISRWGEKTTQYSETVDEPAFRNLQLELLDLAKHSIMEQSSTRKSHSAYISAIDSDLIPLLQEEVKKFRRHIAKIIKEKSKKKDDVYTLQVSLFPNTTD